jgi:hypothetical protein
MNKMHVAMKLIHLLHERRFINSKIVAGELDVSVRTAQRYLNELSMMPCVVNIDNNHTYGLNPDFRLKSFMPATANNHGNNATKPNGGELRQSLCLLCGDNRNYFSRESIFKVSCNITKNNYEMQQLVHRIKLSLTKGKCSFP